MKEELAALKKKRDAGQLTAFKYRQGVRRIKKKYGEDAPSNVTKLLRAAITPSPRSAKAVAARKNRSQSQGGRSRDQVIEEQQKSLARKSAEQGGGSVLSTKAKKKITLPTPPPKRPKKGSKVTAPKPKPKTKAKEKLYTTIDPRTGKAVAKKVSAKKHLANIDAFKARIAADKARAKGSRTRAAGVMTEAEAKRGTATANKLLAKLKKDKKG
tara:strand:+ start:1072 stop:1710 length:639 start_codon:yes stop_codon:yes gene_type:complete